MRILYFGMTGQFSFYPLQALLRTGRQVGTVIIPTPRGSGNSLPHLITETPAESGWAAASADIISLALEAEIPVWQVGSLANPATLELLTRYKPDVICVACFSKILPAPVLALPRLGCLNLHPSLLPAYRGPEPLFWIAYHDERTSGVTLHWLDTDIDSGDIVGQVSVTRPDGMTGCELEQQCAEKGGELLVEALNALSRQEVLPGRLQPTKGASYFSTPTAADMVIKPDWPARRAFNFVRGAEQWPLLVDLGQARYRVRRHEQN